MPLLGWAMLGLLLFIVVSGIDILVGLSRIEPLAGVAPRSGPGPLVTLITAARDEARASRPRPTRCWARTIPRSSS
ncbi:MAG TPA: hypothetical protein VLB00_08885 [Gemmatimonadales bacterium]|nr:hypothetical protein [Gemmatimonadales bacterium]